MARNGSGTYSRINTFSSGATVTAAGHNQNWADLETELTNSLPRDGQAGMSGQFKAANGTVLLPGMTFEADTDTGFYRSAADQVSFAAGGVQKVILGSTGLLTGATNHSLAIPKAWAYVTSADEINYILADSYNVASLLKNGTGDVTITLTNAMSSAAFGVQISPSAVGSFFMLGRPLTASTVGVSIRNSSTVLTNASFTLTVYGSLA